MLIVVELEEAKEEEGAGASGRASAGLGGGGDGPELAEVNAAQDGGHYARYGEAAPQGCGEHAGTHLGTRFV